ncbi:response regulator, partial [Leptospira ellisii]
MKILIADDEPEIRKSLKEILEDEGYEAETFSTGKALLKHLRTERPALVLLDVWLGKEDGIVVLDECKKLYPTLPILMISGHGTIEIAVSATKKGAADFLEKPLSIEKVLQAVDNAVQPEEKNQSADIRLEYDEI